VIGQFIFNSYNPIFSFYYHKERIAELEKVATMESNPPLPMGLKFVVQECQILP
jgi:hypothetical protein